MRQVVGYRVGIPIVCLALLSSLIAVLVGSLSQTKSKVIPECIGRDSFGDGFNFIDIFYSCSDAYRLSLMCLIAAVALVIATGSGYLVASGRWSLTPRSSHVARLMLAGVSVGTLYLIGIYVHEYLFHHGYVEGHRSMRPGFVVGIPIAVSLMHFPTRWGILMAIPIFAMGIVSLIAIAFVTGIPLD